MHAPHAPPTRARATAPLTGCPPFCTAALQLLTRTHSRRGARRYWRPGTAPGPPPGPRPGPHPRPRPPGFEFPPIPAHGAIVPTLVSGNWSTKTSPLPDSKIPQNPLVGNGYTGIIIDGNADFVTLSLNTNSMWHVRPADKGSWPAPGTGSTRSSGHVPTAHRCALGGVTFWAPSANFSVFGATQRIADATLTTTQRTLAGEALSTATVLHPTLQVTTSTLRWNGSTPLKLHVSTWVAAAGMREAGHGATTRDTPAAGSSASCCGEQGEAEPCSGHARTLLRQTHCVARNASADPKTPKQVWAGLSTRIIGGVGGISTTALGVANNASGMWGGSGQLVSFVTTAVELARGQSLTTVTALADSFFDANASTHGSASPLPAAAALATATAPEAITSASDASWAAFWETSSVSTPTLPALEWCWYGSLYMTKGFASPDPSVPPSGLCECLASP